MADGARRRPSASHRCSTPGSIPCARMRSQAYATEVNWKVADMAMQIMAGAGYIMDQDMQLMFRDARVGMIGGGHQRDPAQRHRSLYGP